MPTIDVSDIVSDTDFAQSFTVLRSSGQFGMGGFQSTTTQVSMYGTITVANTKQLQMVPEGDRPIGAMAVYSAQPLYTTRPAGSANAAGVSDILIWNGEQYRVISSKPWRDFGYYLSICDRLGGQS